MKPRALDLFCGAGGATKGLQRAGFHVTGVDNRPQPRYCGDVFHQADALTFPLIGFDFIWASPPCQAFTSLRFMPTAKAHPNLIPQTRARLIATSGEYCIENVEGAPLSGYLTLLCGTMFGLQTPDGRAELRRHRLFETSFSIPLRPRCHHGQSRVGALSVCGDYAEVNRNRQQSRKVLTVCGHTPVDNTARRRAITITGSTPQTNTVRNVARETFSIGDARAAMGVNWMTMAQLSQAIPPAYSEFIGLQVIGLPVQIRDGSGDDVQGPQADQEKR